MEFLKHFLIKSGDICSGGAHFRNTSSIFIHILFHARFTYETDDFNHLDLIQELELDPEFFKVPPAA